MYLRSFRLEAYISFSLWWTGDAIYNFSVHRELYYAIHADNIVNIPLSLTLAPVLNRLAPRSARIIGGGCNSAHAKKLAMHICDRRNHSILGIQCDPVKLEHLNLNTIREPRFFVGIGIGPYKDSWVASRFYMHPFNMQNEVLVLLFRSHYTDRLTGTYKHPAPFRPGVLRCVYIDPFQRNIVFLSCHRRDIFQNYRFPELNGFLWQDFNGAG